MNVGIGLNHIRVIHRTVKLVGLSNRTVKLVGPMAKCNTLMFANPI